MKLLAYWSSTVLAAALLFHSSSCAAEAPAPGFIQQLDAACRAMVKGEIPEARDIYGHVLAAVMHLSKALGIEYSACTMADDGSQFELSFRRREASLSLSCSLSGGTGAMNSTKFQMECAFPGFEVMEDASLTRLVISVICQQILKNQAPPASNGFQKMYRDYFMKSHSLKYIRCEANANDELELSMASHGVRVCDARMALVGSLEFDLYCEIPQELDEKSRRQEPKLNWLLKDEF